MCPGPTVTQTGASSASDLSAGGKCDKQNADRVLNAGLFAPEHHDPNSASEEVRRLYEERRAAAAADAQVQTPSTATPGGSSTSSKPAADQEVRHYSMEETLFVFDWDDTLLPSTWLHRQGLRLDDGSQVNSWHREQLNKVAETALELIKNAKQAGKVVLVTNAERGWIELSCQKFLPQLLPLLENIKAVSARTTFESKQVSSPLDWKLLAFEQEIDTIYGKDKLFCPDSRKNVFSLGDSVHEREALLRACADLPNCNAKSLKFVERPDISQIVKQHNLVNNCFDRVMHHEGNLDLCIKCN